MFRTRASPADRVAGATGKPNVVALQGCPVVEPGPIHYTT